MNTTSIKRGLPAMHPGELLYEDIPESGERGSSAS